VVDEVELRAAEEALRCSSELERLHYQLLSRHCGTASSLRFKVLFESLFPGMLLLNSPIGFLRDPIPYSAEALMIHEVCNKGFTKPILDLFATCRFRLTSLFDKNSLCSSYRELSSDVTSIFGPNVVQTI